MREWIIDQQRRGNDFAVKSGERLRAEFGDIDLPTEGATAILKTAALLTELQEMTERSIGAEELIVETTFNLIPSDIILSNFEVTYKKNAIEAGEEVQVTATLNDVTFIRFALNGDRNWQSIFFSFIEGKGLNFNIPVQDLIRVAEIKP